MPFSARAFHFFNSKYHFYMAEQFLTVSIFTYPKTTLDKLKSNKGNMQPLQADIFPYIKIETPNYSKT